MIRSTSNTILLFWCALLLLFIPISAFAEEPSGEGFIPGEPFLFTVDPTEFGFEPSCYNIELNSQGIIFVGNLSGVLEYDGVSWQLLAEGHPGRSIAIDSSNVVYIGGIGDIGFLEKSANGPTEYRSLLDKLPENKRFFAAVRNTTAIGKAVYFQTTRHVFRWLNEKMTVWDSQSSFQWGGRIGSRYFVQDTEHGLCELKEEALVPLSNAANEGLKFANSISALSDGRMLITTLVKGLFVYDGISCLPFQTEVDDYLTAHRIRTMQVLGGDAIAVGTLTGGIVILNPSGSLRQIFDSDAGLTYDNAFSLLEDSQGGLWATHFKGVSRIQIDGSLTLLNDLENNGTAFDLLEYNGIFYVAGSAGVLYHRIKKNASVFSQRFTFEQIEGLNFSCFDLLVTSNGLLAATAQGIFKIVEGRAVKLETDWNRSVELYASKKIPGRVYVGLIDGLAVLQLENGRWKDLGRVTEVTESIHDLIEDTEGNLWLGAAFRDVLKLPPVRDRSQLPANAIRYDKTHGVSNQSYLSEIDDRVLLLTESGIKRFDAKQETFVPELGFGSLLSDSTVTVRRLRKDLDGNLWTYLADAKRGHTLLGTRSDDGSYEWDAKAFQRLPQFQQRWTSFYSQKGGITWLGGVSGVLRYDSNRRRTIQTPLNVFIRSFKVSDDSLVWSDRSSVNPPSEATPIQLQYSQNAVTFEFAAPWFDAGRENRYQFYLEGFDESWSEWRDVSQKEYTNLPEGDFRFRVRARNIYGQISNDAVLAFTIAPPWYRSWLAYLCYAIAFIGLVLGVVKFRVRQLEQKTLELEEQVKARTLTLREQNEQIEQQALKLRELDRFKSRFFTNISHEFRTPLTLILGPIEDMLSRSKATKDRESLGLMQRNGRRLLQLINQLLDLSRLESGRLKLEVRPGNLRAFLKGIVLSFASLAEKRRVTLELDIAPEKSFENAFFDPDTIEKIVVNLVSNAFRFTEAGGRIRVTLNPKGQKAELAVSDTGKGIAADKLKLIFERFHSEAAGQGSGVGLSLTKEMVLLHHGTIAVESSPGVGSCFTTLLAYRRDDFNEAEILQEAGEESYELLAEISEKTLLEDDPIPSDEKQIEQDSDNAEQPVILIVEDHPDVMHYIRKQLSNDYIIITAENGSEGLQLALEHVPDLIISDVMMPVMDGYELCKEVKTSDKTNHVPVILLTAKADDSDKIAGLETGADDYLVKPFNAKELRTRIANLIEQRAKLRERYRREGILQPKDVAATSMEEAFLRRLVEIVDTHLTDEDFGPDVLGSALNMSTRQMQRKIRAITGQTPTDFIRSQRLQRARMLLEQRTGSVSEIAYEVGFNNLSYFARSFRKEFGVAPSELLTGKK